MKKYGIVPHCELEQHHYKAINENAAYREQFNMDVLREEMSGYAYRSPLEEPSQPTVVPPCNNQHGVDSVKGGLIRLEDALKEHIKNSGYKPKPKPINKFQ